MEEKIITAAEAIQLSKKKETFLFTKSRIMSEIMDEINARASSGFFDAKIQLNVLYDFEKYQLDDELRKLGYIVDFSRETNLLSIFWTEK